jgi:hypothetical protein
MIVTSLLVKWSEGWHEVASLTGIAMWGRKEATLGLGAAQSVDEVNTVGTQQLTIFADPRTEIACDVAPRTEAETPIAGYTAGDTIIVPDRTGQPPIRERIQAITATVDEDGRVTYAVELRDVLLDEQERMAESIAKMANGTLGGDSKVAQPIMFFPSLSEPNMTPSPPGPA